MKQEISHNNLPEAIGWLLDKVTSMESIMRDLANPNQSKSIKSILTAKETATYLNVTLPTLYNWTKQGKITKLKIGGTRIGFKAEDVESLLFKVESKRK